VRGLVILTLTVALLIGGSREARSLFTGAGAWIIRPHPLPLVFWGFPYVIVGLLALWATLGLAPPRKRCMLVLAVAPLSGVLFWYGLCYGYAENEFWELVPHHALVMLLEAAFLLASLYVVRTCGYRLAGPVLPETVRPDPPSTPLDGSRTVWTTAGIALLAWGLFHGTELVLLSSYYGWQSGSHESRARFPMLMVSELNGIIDHISTHGKLSFFRNQTDFSRNVRSRLMSVRDPEERIAYLQSVRGLYNRHADYHLRMKRKYDHAVWHPWDAVPPDPPPPPPYP
jgi:hypothetical protein